MKTTTNFLLFLSTIILFPALLHASELKACYDIKILFLKVGESCISYHDAGDVIKVDSHMRTVNIGSAAKRVEDTGGSTMKKEGLQPHTFVFYQEEGRFKRYQEYVFEKQIIKVRETRYKGLSDVMSKDENKTYPWKGEADPYTVALRLFVESMGKKEGTVKIFYDDRFYTIPFKVKREEEISLDEDTYDTICVWIKPEIKGKGLLQPRGDWYLWLDKKTRLPVKMSVGFIIGSVKVYLQKMEGDKNLIRRLFDQDKKKTGKKQ